ncbi:MAG: acetyl-CoA C-acyltransferase, partial [Desulfobacterium sp.]
MGGQNPAPNTTLMAERPDTYTPMGITAENVASKYEVSRAEQDAFATRSHQRAADAIASGRFKDEIIPVDVRVFKGGVWHDVTFDTD